MESTDLETLTAASRWLAEGYAVVLVTVARTWGSSPRPTGAIMAIGADGRFSGSVSGGCIEEDLLQRLAAGDWPRGVRTMSYGVTADEAARFGLPCGGRVTLVLEPLASDALASVVDAIRARRLVVRHLDVSAGKARVEPARAATEAFSFDGGYMSRVFGPRWRLLMVGAGQIAGYLAEIARSLDYEVQLCDPRSEQLQGWEARHERIDLSMPDDCLRRMQPDERTAVVTLSHDPKLDDLALLEALDSPAFYVGALGSTRSHDRRRQRLASLGVSPDGLERLRGPVGLPIGSRTPPEIAVSIVAELTAARRGAKAADQRLRQPTSRHSEP